MEERSVQIFIPYKRIFILVFSEELPDIANTIGQTFSNNSSINNYTPKFEAFRTRAETSKISYKSNNLETYNDLFSPNELANAISKSQDTAVGLDDIHYQMLKHLSPNSMLTLLDILNSV